MDRRFFAIHPIRGAKLAAKGAPGTATRPRTFNIITQCQQALSAVAFIICHAELLLHPLGDLLVYRRALTDEQRL